MSRSAEYEQLQISNDIENNAEEDVIAVGAEEDQFEERNHAKKCHQRLPFDARLFVFIISAVLISVAIVLSILFAVGAFSKESQGHPDAECVDSCCIFCDGEILDVVQSLNFFNDSKV